MKETKDDNWSDWLINDKLRWERFGSFGWKERVSMCKYVDWDCIG